MKELEEQIQIIYNELTEKLIPENIRYGVNILGVVGQGVFPEVTLTEKIIKDDTNEVATKYTNVKGEEEIPIENKITTNYFPLNLDIRVNGALVKSNEQITIVKDSTVNINVPKTNILNGKYNITDDLEGNIENTKTESEIAPTIEERLEGEGNTLFTDGSTWVQYELTSPMSDFILEFEFYKSDNGAYNRVLGLVGTNFEIEIKGSSNSIYWGVEYNGGWIQNAWNKLKIVRKGSDTSLYINDKLIATRNYASELTAIFIGRGNTETNFFNGYYRNFMLMDKIPEITINVSEDGGNE